MFTEIFGFLKDMVKPEQLVDTMKVNLSNRRIRSISSFSSNSIFYFPVIVSDQCQLDEVTMMARALEKQYASFVVACVSLIPFHRVSSGNAWAVDEYLKQFHQNIGIAPGADAFSHAYSKAVKAGLIEASTVIVPPPMIGVDDFFLKVWNESVEKDQDYVSYLIENYISLNDVFNENATDPYVRALTQRYKAVNEEMSTWGFVGSEPPDAMVNGGHIHESEDGYEPQNPYANPDDPFGSSSDLITDEDDGLYTTNEAANPVDRVKYTLESITDNKIKSCKNRTKLRSMESKLNGLKKKYTSYLRRYKKRYEENEKTGTKKKLIIRFNKEHIDDPKAFMQEYGSYMKVINHKLELCKARREELTARAGKGNVVTANESVAFDMDYSKYLMDEASIKASVRNKIPDDQFGIPDKRKFPLHDAKHIKLAIQMSGHSDVKDREELATNIAKRASELNMDIAVSKNNPLYKYLPKSMQESSEVDIINDLSDLDEQAIDSLLETIDAQLNAPDNEVFRLVNEDGTYDDMYDMYQRLHASEQLNAKLAKEKAGVFKAHKDYVEDKTHELEDKTHELEDLQKRNTNLSKLASDYMDRTSKEMESLRKENETLKKSAADKNAKSRKSLTITNRGPNRGQIDMAKRKNANPDHDYRVNTFDREVFTKMDMQKANEMVPTFAKASIGFIVDETEQVETRDVLIGVKTYVHRVQSGILVNEIYQAIMSRRKFLKFVKFISGEERSLADLLFGFKELKVDAHNTRSDASRWQSAFKQRKRLSKMSVPYIMNNYLPNGTIIMTMNEAEYMKNEYGVDILRGDHAKMIMDANFLLGFVVLDQTNEIAYVMYDGVNQNQFQQYSFAALEREQKNNERDMRELFRLVNR